MPKIGKDLIPHQLGLTQAQINKLIDGKPVNIAHRTMGSGAGDTVMLLKPQNARKLLTAYKKGKGMRMTLHPDEIHHSVVSGRGFGKKLMKGLRSVAKNPMVKELGKELLQEGTQALGAAIGSYTGNPQVGMMIGDSLGKAGSQAIDSGSLKKGVRSLKSDARSVALNAMEKGIEELPEEYRGAARMALSGDTSGALSNVMDQKMAQYDYSKGYGIVRKGSAEMKERMAMLRAMKGGKVNIGKKIVKGLERVGKPVASTLIHAGIPVALGVAGNVLGGPLGGVAGATAGQMIADRVGKSTGMGVRARGRPRKVGGEVATSSKAYKKALRLNYAGLELVPKTPNNAPLGDYDVNPRVRVSSTEMTLSPYARMDSPAMNPFIPTHYTQQGGTSCGYGGRGIGGVGLYGYGLY